MAKGICMARGKTSNFIQDWKPFMDFFLLPENEKKNKMVISGFAE